MHPKQAEMDGIIQKIYTGIETQPHLNDTLFVLVGDHGMNDAGGHGGSTAGETSSAMLFMSPKFKNYTNGGFPAPAKPHNEFRFHTLVEQTDITPTLAALLHFPIPRNNVGRVIPSFLPMWGGMCSTGTLYKRSCAEKKKNRIGYKFLFTMPSKCSKLSSQPSRILSH